MTAAEFLAELGTKDIRVWAEGDRLRCNAPAGAVTPEMRDQLRDRKSELLEFLRAAEAAASQQPAIVPLQARGSRTPVYGVPGHTGDVFCFSDFVKRLGDDGPFFALQPPGLDGKSALIDTVEDIAVYFADQIRAFQPSGPVVIAGYCSGGATAFEIARVLAARGTTVEQVALFGCPFPSSFRKLPQFLIQSRYWTGRMFLHLKKILRMGFGDARKYLGDRFRGRLKAMREDEADAAPGPDPVLALRGRLKKSAMAAVRRYAPESYAGRVCMYLPNKAWVRSGTKPMRWLRAAPQAEIYYGPDETNGPLMLLEPDAPAFAELYRRAGAPALTRERVSAR